MWLWDEANAIRYFPNEDGSFELNCDEFQCSRFRVEGPQLPRQVDDGGASYSAATCRPKSCVNTILLPPRNCEKRLRIADREDVCEVESASSSNSQLDFDLLILEEVRGDVGILRRDVGILRRDVGILQRDVSILLRSLGNASPPGPQNPRANLM